MVKYENQYMDCDVSHHYCSDDCKVHELYKYDIDATELCETCLLNKRNKVR